MVRKRKSRKIMKSNRLSRNNKILLGLLMVMIVAGIGSQFMSIYAGGWDFSSYIHSVSVKGTKYTADTDTVYNQTFDRTSVVWDPDGDFVAAAGITSNEIPEISIYISNFFSINKNGTILESPEPYSTKIVQLEGYHLKYNYYHLGYDIAIRTMADAVDPRWGYPGYYEGAEFFIDIVSRVQFSGVDYRKLGSNETAWAGILSISCYNISSGSTVEVSDAATADTFYQPYYTKGFPVEGSLFNMRVDNGSYINTSDEAIDILNVPSVVDFDLHGIMRAGGITPYVGATTVFDVYVKIRILVDVITINNYVPTLSETTGLSDPHDYVRFASNWFDVFFGPGADTRMNIIGVIIVIAIVYVLYKIFK